MEPSYAVWVLLIGATILAAAVIDSAAHHARIPSVVGYLAIGLLLHIADERWGWLGEPGRHAFGLLAELGIVALLFRVGLHSHVHRLAAKIGPALLIWAGNVGISGLAGFSAAYYMGLGLPGALIVATALTATSIGVAAAAWQSREALDSPDGDLMLDVAELDDLSAVLFMAFVFAVAPALADGASWVPALVSSSAEFATKFVAFGAICFLFARYAEAPLTRFATARERAPQRMLVVAGAAFVIAALAAWLGFSLAIGGLFAGLLFSRDPRAIRAEAGFDDIHDFLMPFFFVGIGLGTDIGAIGAAWTSGVVLLVVAIAGKIAGTTLPALLVTRPKAAWLLGVSMIPRAEIALVVAYQGLALGLLGERGYAALVFVSVATCVVSPPFIAALIDKPTSNRRAETPRGRR